MATPFVMIRDQAGYQSFATPFNDPTYTYSCTLASATAASLTVPTGPANTKWLAIITYAPGANVWVALNTTAAVPAGSTFAATASHQLPAPKVVNAGDVLSFITIISGGVDVGVQLYAL